MPPNSHPTPAEAISLGLIEFKPGFFFCKGQTREEKKRNISWDSIKGNNNT
jgi:hypothetical protein